MAPKSKREATPEQSEEVCKKLKEDLKETTKPIVSNETKVKANDQHNNNNDINNGAQSNGNAKAVSAEQQQDKERPKDELTTSGDKTEPKKEVEASVQQQNGDKPAEQAKEKTEAITKEEKEDEEVSTKHSATTSADDDKKKPEDVVTNGDKAATAPSTNKEDPKPSAESASKSAAAKEEKQVEEEATTGTLLICGGANWDMTGRKELPKNAKKPVDVNPAARNLWGPMRVVDGDETLRVKGVFSGCNACHSVIVTEDGRTMTFGRNDKGQLGLGDTNTRITPVTIDAFDGIDIIAAACGRSHTLFLDSDGIVYSCGDNKMGQCGTNQQSVHTITSPQRIAFKEDKKVVKIACGAEFSMIVDSDGRLYSFGHPEHGQLGHGSEGKYFTSGNKYAFHCEYAPRRIVTWIEKSREGHVSHVDDVHIVDVACGTNHTLAVDTKHRCFSWGFAGYHRLGHSETKNELVPRSIKLFDAPPSTGRGAAKVFAGATHSMALDLNGLLYFWGQNKSSGEATMYPKNVQDLCGWKIRAVSCANRSIFVLADESCVSWGPSPTYGELGYGEGKSKSSTIPQEVRTLDGVHIIKVACGFGHTLLMGRDRTPEEKSLIEKFKPWP